MPIDDLPPPIPPKGGSGVGPKKCDHRYVLLSTAKWTDGAGEFNTHFIRVDRFYCERCLADKELRKEERARDTPDWYR